MQDNESEVDDQPPQEESVAEVVAPSPEPQPEQVIEVPVVEPAPEPIAPEPIPEPTPTPEIPLPVPEPESLTIVKPTPPVVPTPPELPTPDPEVAELLKPVEPTPEPPKEELVIVPPPVPAPKKPVGDNGIPQKVLDLTPAELDAARRLWATQTIHDTQKKSVQARKDRVEQNMQRVEHFVKKYGPTTVRTVGLELGMSTRSASTYLIDLYKKGKIKATGQTTSRRYS